MRKRRRRPDTSPAVAREGVEDGSSTPVPPAFGIFRVEGWVGEPSRRRAGAEKRNSEGEGEGQKEGTN